MFKDFCISIAEKLCESTYERAWIIGNFVCRPICAYLAPPGCLVGRRRPGASRAIAHCSAGSRTHVMLCDTPRVTSSFPEGVVLGPQVVCRRASTSQRQTEEGAERSGAARLTSQRLVHRRRLREVRLPFRRSANTSRRPDPLETLHLNFIAMQHKLIEIGQAQKGKVEAAGAASGVCAPRWSSPNKAASVRVPTGLRALPPPRRTPRAFSKQGRAPVRRFGVAFMFRSNKEQPLNFLPVLLKECERLVPKLDTEYLFYRPPGSHSAVCELRNTMRRSAVRQIHNKERCGLQQYFR
ncbi:hypothetical protein EVAR_32798_1 [Eumeta japonica]|uniref:Uncharacterized protein n=1 Tax=Eumeta variegata TaxID=151549 RepID=A0A4C1WF76_EUMVA|nr:hypothetical protein EVAR_32798_1 [Eumeta japonica]